MFSEELKALRIRLGLTQQAMADRLNVDRSTYCRWEHTERPPAYVLERISKEFEVDAWNWVRPEEPATTETGPRVVHLRNEEAEEDNEERHWRLRALDLLARITDLVEGIVKSPGKRGGGIVENIRTAKPTLRGRLLAYGVCVGVLQNCTGRRTCTRTGWPRSAPGSQGAVRRMASTTCCSTCGPLLCTTLMSDSSPSFSTMKLAV